MITLTESLLTPKGPSQGFNRQQLEILGVAWPPVSGWKKRTIGKVISEEDYEQFLILGERKAWHRRDDAKLKRNGQIELL